MDESRSRHHRVVIVGGGTAGLTVAARLARAKVDDVVVVEPSERHYYQPLWTLVGGGLASADSTVRKTASVIPRGVSWVREAAVAVDPDERTVSLDSGKELTYDYLVVAPGIQLDWAKVEGLPESLGNGKVSSNYRFDLAPRTWDGIRGMRSGTALFTMPPGAIKCAGAPQKIAYLASDYWQRNGVLGRIRVILVLPGAAVFGVPEFARPLERVIDRYGIEVRYQTELSAIDGEAGKAMLKSLADPGAPTEALEFDFAHVVPPQSAPEWVKASPLADGANPAGYVEVDKYTMAHVRWPNVFSLGDAGSTPNSKTGAAVRKQAPVVVANLLAAMRGEQPVKFYDGYASCPLVTSHNRCIMAEFDYVPKPTPTFPVLNMQKERYDMYLVKRYGLPLMYWNLMLKGLA